MTDEAPVVVIERAVTVRRSARREFVLRIPEFRAAAGGITAITGPSGSGKSTFLDLLACIQPPADAVRFHLCGEELGGVLLKADKAAVLRRSIGFVLQHGALLPFLNVADNIRLGAALAGRNPRQEEIRELARQLGIDSLLREFPARISGGQRQRAALARALAQKPPLILADEPTGSVDAARSMEIGELLRGVAAVHQIAVVLVTHDSALAEAVAAQRYHVQPVPGPSTATDVDRQTSILSPG